MFFKRADQSEIIDGILKESAVKEYKVERSWPKVLKIFKEQVLKSIETEPKNVKDDVSDIIFQTDNIHPNYLDRELSEYISMEWPPSRRTFDDSPSTIKRHLKSIIEKSAKKYQQDIKDYFSDRMNFPPGHSKINFVFKKIDSEPIMKEFSIIQTEE